MPMNEDFFENLRELDYEDNNNFVVADQVVEYTRPIKTYYANAKIFSPRIPRRFPRQVDKLSLNVFDDE